jgi:hypothetical protein
MILLMKIILKFLIVDLLVFCLDYMICLTIINFQSKNNLLDFLLNLMDKFLIFQKKNYLLIVINYT